MALITYTALVSSLRGRYAGTQFRTNQLGGSGTFHPQPVKSHSKLTKADAGRMGAPKRNVTFVSQYWRTLSGSAQNGWKALASVTPHVNKYGNSVYLSGFQYFLMVNLKLVSNEQTILDEAPVPGELFLLTSWGTTWDLSLSEFFINLNDVAPANFVCTVYAGVQRNPGSGVRTRNLKLMGVTAIASSTEFNIFQTYIDTFGYPTVGNVVDVWLYVLDTNTGQSSPSYYTFGTINA